MMTEPMEQSPHTGFRLGRIISPGTPRQLGVFGLFRPSAAQRRILTVADRPLEVKNAEAGLLWIGFRQLVAGAASAADLAGLAAQFGVWVVDGVPSSVEDTAGSPIRQLLSEAVGVLFEADVTLFLIGASPPGFGADSPLSLLLRVESDEDLAAEHESGS